MHPQFLHHQQHPAYFNLRNPCMINRNQRCAGVSVSVRRSKSGRQIAVAAARDRVIDFGKYKGKMLGSLPSSYLRWVSKNLRARDFEEWANLADQVLRDPIYRDRIEWEFALSVLNGNSTTATSSSLPVRGAVSELRDISERFGWDDLNKMAWTKVDFDLLGTSKGGRIPRLVNPNHIDTADSQPKRPPSPTTTTTIGSSSSRRMERRERRKTRLMTRKPQPQQQINNVVAVADEDSIRVKEDDDDHNIAIPNPFPGRQTLLLKAINHRNY